MVALALPAHSPVVEAIDQAYVRENAESGRPHSARLGASIIGRKCARSLWYSFRWATPPIFPGRILRLFKTGHIEEDRMAADLRRIGVEVHQIDEATGEQFELVGCRGHFVCKLDGALLGVPGAPKTWHSWEAKTHNEKSFATLTQKGVIESKPEHYAQCQAGMHLSSLTRCLYMAKNKNDDSLYTERIRIDKDFCDRLFVKASRIIFTPHPLEKARETPEGWGPCTFCDHKALCFEGSLPQRNCRTCAHSTPVDEGKWTCSVAAQARAIVNGTSPEDYQGDVFELSYEEQAKGCRNHLYIPQLVDGEIVGAEELNITYRLKSGEGWTDGPRDDHP